MPHSLSSVTLIFVSCVAFLLTTVVPFHDVQAQPRQGLFAQFQPPPGRSIAGQEKKEHAAIRSRHVQIGIDEVAGFHLSEGADALMLNLFDDTVLIAHKERFERRSPGRFTWHGKVGGYEHSQVTIVVHDGVVVGNVRVNGKAFQIRYSDAGVHEIHEIDGSLYLPEADALPVSGAELPAADFPVMEADSGGTIDVMVVYTPAARSPAGGTAAMEALIFLGIAEMNQVFVDSGIAPRVNLVHRAEVAYVESGNMSTDLARLTLVDDGHIDKVHMLRDTYRADVVSMWQEGGGYHGPWVLSRVPLRPMPSAW